MEVPELEDEQHSPKISVEQNGNYPDSHSSNDRTGADHPRLVGRDYASR
jgi:hypothetical protein